MATKTFKKVSARSVEIFKIKNRRGYAALCMENLTEGSTPHQAFQRMIKAVKRHGFEITGPAPGSR